MYSFRTDKQIIVIGLALAGASRSQIVDHLRAIGKPMTPMGVSVLLSHARDQGLIPKGYHYRAVRIVRLDPVLSHRFTIEARKRGQLLERFIDTLLRHLLRDNLIGAVLDEDYIPSDEARSPAISPRGECF